MNRSENTWSVDTWKEKPNALSFLFQDDPNLSKNLETIKNYPPLVFSQEIENLKKHLTDASIGEKFIIQGGDCAERFRDCTPKAILNKLRTLIQMSVLITNGTKVPVIKVGRIAGQYAKPRSQKYEGHNGKELYSYFGDMVNDFHFSENSRKPDSKRIVDAYHNSSMTLNFIRALIAGGFDDLNNPSLWNLDFGGRSPVHNEYQSILTEITKSFKNEVSFKNLLSHEFYTSHECLILEFEHAITRFVHAYERFYNLGAHMVWIGERTRDLDGAHVEYCRGIANPVGVKVGPMASASELSNLYERLNPDNEPGKVVFITRLGSLEVENRLPTLLSELKGKNIVWFCDPMHGNTKITGSGLKTRYFDDILRELELTKRIHNTGNSCLAGVHFELTGEDVTECIGGLNGPTESELSRGYETYCDPRLNYYQSLDMAMRISRFENLNP